MPSLHRSSLSLCVLALMAGGCGAADHGGKQPAPAATEARRCLPDASGFLRAQLRGALNADLDWRDAQIHCEGGARPDGAGLRVSIAGPLPASAGEHAGRTLRFVFGIDDAAGATEGQALATNLTAILEGTPTGDAEMFSTRGDDKCTADRLQRRDLVDADGKALTRRETDGASLRDYRVDVRGFCLGPASSLDGSDRLLVTTFDFAGRVALEMPAEKR